MSIGEKRRAANILGNCQSTNQLPKRSKPKDDTESQNESHSLQLANANDNQVAEMPKDNHSTTALSVNSKPLKIRIKPLKPPPTPKSPEMLGWQLHGCTVNIITKDEAK